MSFGDFVYWECTRRSRGKLRKQARGRPGTSSVSGRNGCTKTVMEEIGLLISLRKAMAEAQFDTTLENLAHC